MKRIIRYPGMALIVEVPREADDFYDDFHDDPWPSRPRAPEVDVFQEEMWSVPALVPPLAGEVHPLRARLGGSGLPQVRTDPRLANSRALSHLPTDPAAVKFL